MPESPIFATVNETVSISGYDLVVAEPVMYVASTSTSVARVPLRIVPAYTLNFVVPDGTFANTSTLLIGIGMWLGTIMWFNVWFVIWPNQQKALNIGNAYPDLPAAEKAKSARTAGMFSRVNTVLSVPMLFCMAGAPHLV